MLQRVRTAAEEVLRIGPAAAGYRAWRMILQRSGVDVRLQPIRTPGGIGITTDDRDALSRWRSDAPTFFVDGLGEISDYLRVALPEADRRTLIEDGFKAARGVILAFRCWEADFGHPPRWLLNPVEGVEWPAVHSKRVLSSASRSCCGDIKYTWEIGRFLHVVDVLRAYAVVRDEELMDSLFAQVESFDEANPMFFGPHWISEQEAAIRGCMFALLLHGLRGTPALTDERLVLLARQIAASATFCHYELAFARLAIDNNHLIAGALCLYVAGTVLPWHGEAHRWRARGRRHILAAVNRQWNEDGSFVQPSHNYHRLALSYLLWALRLAELQDDITLSTAIRRRLGRSFDLLNSFVMADRGRFPNWGPNDGALFAPWTSCDFRDYRPLLTTLRFATAGLRQYDVGPWDEQLLWLWGATSVEAPIGAQCPREGTFPEAGLHTLRRPSDQALLVFRAGPILSRFGQQADQLTIDLTWRGFNILCDPGSYSYADPAMHEWMRSTDAHNTIVVGGVSQMIPHRQFLFLGWPRTDLLEVTTAPAGVRAWYAARHDGYRRLRQDIMHRRLVAELETGTWLVVDHVAAYRPSKPFSVDLRWHLAPGEATVVKDGVDHQSPVGTFALRWSATAIARVAVAEGQHTPVDGWVSDYYGQRDPAPAIRLSWRVRDELTVATVMGDVSEAGATPIHLSPGSVSAGRAVVPLRPGLADS